MKHKLKLITLTSIAIVALMAMLLYDLYLHNFYTVIPHQVYRSRELSKNQFEQAIQQYHLRSIINLRGTHPTSTWYIQEMKAVHHEDINHYNVKLNSKSMPPIPVLKQLVNILAKAPRPMLIHCESGVDRTALAAAITLILANRPMPDLEHQLSLRYFVSSHQSVGKQVLRRYRAWLQRNNLKTSRKNFYTWLQQL